MSSVEEFRTERELIRANLGGLAKVEDLHSRGRRTVRERIDALVDPDSFVELGTFVRAQRLADRAATPGDGKIGGHATIAGESVVVAGDDITVKHASNAHSGARKIERLVEHALTQGTPFIFFGEGGGARLPEILGSEGLTRARMLDVSSRAVPKVTVIVGNSFGFPSFMSAFSDLVVQVKGSCLAVVSPRVVEGATGESVTPDELGGVEVHSRITGQIDIATETEDDAIARVKEFLDLVPSNSWTRPVKLPSSPELLYDPTLSDLVPEERRRAYDVRQVISRVLDPGPFLELKPLFGRSLVTGLGRLNGWTVGVMASQPMFEAGALSPQACDKATRLLILCDTYDIPIVFLQDTPGFLIGKSAEHSKVLSKAVMFFQALMKARCPRLTVVLRKGFGLAFTVLGGTHTGSDLICAWPNSELSQMDPGTGANVVRREPNDQEQRADNTNSSSDEMAADVRPYGAAVAMGIDEIIDPGDTRRILGLELDRLGQRKFDPNQPSPLASWPTCW
jgi:methylmalonyl-CoA decarboxylase subunit alpha